MYAAPFSFLETTVTQPDGSQLTLYASGDEFYHWVHDKDGYTVLQGEDGYCYYAEKNDMGELVPSPFLVGKTSIVDTKLVVNVCNLYHGQGECFNLNMLLIKSL